MGIGGMQNYCNKEANEIELNLKQVIVNCKVQNVILLLDADCLRVEYKDKRSCDTSSKLPFCGYEILGASKAV